MINKLSTNLIVVFSVCLLGCYSESIQQQNVIQDFATSVENERQLPQRLDILLMDFIVGKDTVDTMINKYPDLKKADASYVTYGHKRLLMKNTYYFISGKTIYFFQFDDDSNILQNAFILNYPIEFNKASIIYQKNIKLQKIFHLKNFKHLITQIFNIAVIKNILYVIN